MLKDEQDYPDHPDSKPNPEHSPFAHMEFLHKITFCAYNEK